MIIYFALLTDFPDAEQERLSGDEALERRAGRYPALNVKYQRDRPCIFYLFHRPAGGTSGTGFDGVRTQARKAGRFNRCLRGGSPNVFHHRW
jgi:hypothetical protein